MHAQMNISSLQFILTLCLGTFLMKMTVKQSEKRRLCILPFCVLRLLEGPVKVIQAYRFDLACILYTKYPHVELTSLSAERQTSTAVSGSSCCLAGLGLMHPDPLSSVT